MPTDANTLSIEEKRKALRAMNLIKEKRNGTLKGRTCADGSSQRQHLKQDESVASSTASLESMLTTLLIDAHEGRDVATFAGACLQADLNEGDDKERVILKLTGDFVDATCQVNPEHTVNVTCENGKKALCMAILKAMCGCIYNIHA